MKKLEDLKINNDKIINYDELIKLSGGKDQENYRCVCQGDNYNSWNFYGMSWAYVQASMATHCYYDEGYLCASW